MAKKEHEAENTSEGVLNGQHRLHGLWTQAVRSWGEATSEWLDQYASSNHGQESLKELQQAAVDAAKAWARLPIFFVKGGQPTELRQVLAHFAEAQGHAYQLWLKALKPPSIVTSAKNAEEQAPGRPAPQRRKRSRKASGKKSAGTRRRRRTASNQSKKSLTR